MEVKFYVHGTPYGFKYRGEEDEKDMFFKRYYESLKEYNELKITAISRNGKNYFYYSYIFAKNVFDGQNNRANAYFGITVRFDCYYKKVRNLYYLLDSFFYSYFYGKFIAQSGGMFKFLFSDFDSGRAKTIVDEALSSLGEMIGRSLSEYDLSTLTFQRGNMSNISLVDAEEGYVIDAIKKSGAVSLSEAHPSNACEKIISEKNAEIQKVMDEANEKVRKANNEKEDGINAVRKQYANADNRIKSLEKDLRSERTVKEKLEKDLKAKSDETNVVKSELSTLKSQYESSQYAEAKLKDIWNALSKAGIFQNGNQHESQQSKPHKLLPSNKGLLLINTFLSGLVFVLLLVLLILFVIRFVF